MLSTELRIGNLVHRFENDKISVIWSLREKYCDFLISRQGKQTISQSASYEKLRPVVLTEEMLIKLKAYRQSHLEYSIGRLYLIYKPNYNYWYVVDVSLYYYYTKVEFVHELQNLINALDSTELDVTPLLNEK